MRSKPGEKEWAEGEQEAEEEKEGGCQGDRIHRQTDMVEQFCGESRHSWSKVMTSETQDSEKGD